MDLLQNLLFAFLGRLFETINIVSQQAYIDTCFLSKPYKSALLKNKGDLGRRIKIETISYKSSPFAWL
jgi:hypothetical protein